MRCQEIALENKLPFVQLVETRRRQSAHLQGRALHRRRRPVLQSRAPVGGGPAGDRGGARLLHRGRRLPARAVRLRDHGARPRQGLPRRAAAAEGRDRRDRHRRGPGRGRDACARVGPGRVRRRGRCRCHPHRARSARQPQVGTRSRGTSARRRRARAAAGCGRDRRPDAADHAQARGHARSDLAHRRRFRIPRIQARLRPVHRVRPRRDRRAQGRLHQQQRPARSGRRDQGDAVHPALLPGADAARLSAEHHRLHRRHQVRGRAA